MNELELILKQNGVKFESQGGIIFPIVCPLCKSEEGSPTLSDEIYNCSDCCPENITLADFFKRLGVQYDSSSTNFPDLFEANIEEAFNPERVIGIPTGIPSLDKATKGLLKGHTYILSADTGHGKSVFACNLINNVIQKEGKNCSYFDLENGRFANFTRFVSIAGSKPANFFEDVSNKAEAIKISKKFDGKLIYRDHVKLASLTQNSQGLELAKAIGLLIREDVKKHEVRFVVIDPLEEFELEETNYNSIAKVIKYFTELAQELGISILILHHLKKPKESSQKTVDSLDPATITPATYMIPTINDVIGTKKLTNTATDVWVLVRQIHHKDSYERGKTLLRILKFRESEGGDDVFMVMNTSTLKMGELATEYYPGQNQLEIEEEANL